MDRVALLGSLVAHVIAAALLLAVARPPGAPGARDAPAAAVAIELIEIAPAAPIEDVTGGGTSPSERAAEAPVRGRAREIRRAPPAARTVREAIGPIAIDRATGQGTAAEGGLDLAGEGTGGGACTGRACGAGIGLGDGGRIARAPDLPAPPPAPAAPPPSKARPATLIYPVRHREVDDAELFVARVTVDAEGYVIGARLVRGFNGPRDSEASALIFRFRYDPARDDAGRAIRSTFEQRFLVNR